MDDVKKYFVDLNYTSTNEDTLLELAVMGKNRKNVLCISGSGARALPLIGKTSEKLVLVDYSPMQMQLTELRIASLAALDYEDYLAFWGYPAREMQPKERQNVFEKLSLAPETRERFSKIFAEISWQSLLYLGRWERTMAKMGHFMKTALGRPVTKGASESWRLKLALFMATNKNVFNSLLYRGKFPSLNLSPSNYLYHKNIFDKLLSQFEVEENYFLQTVFFGKIMSRKDLPAEVMFEQFNMAKANLKNIKIEYRVGNLFEIIGQEKHSFDFVSLSDIPSYFDKMLGENFLQQLSPVLAKDALVVSRYYCYRPTNINIVNYDDLTSSFASEIRKERTQIYFFDIWKKAGNI